MNGVVLLLGSNIDPERNLVRAIERLGRYADIRTLSQVYQTAPVGGREQPDFLNAALLLYSEYSPEELKGQVLRRIEAELGRVRTADKNAARTIDLDIALYGSGGQCCRNWRLADPELLLYPHSVLPLAELCSDWIDERSGRALHQIAAVLDTEGLRPRKDIDLSIETKDERGTGCRH